MVTVWLPEALPVPVTAPPTRPVPRSDPPVTLTAVAKEAKVRLPNLYLYAANNPSEGTIAKRRSAATLISYLTPPVAHAGLYRGLLDLKGSIERWRGLTPDAAESERSDLAALIQAQAAALDLATAARAGVDPPRASEHRATVRDLPAHERPSHGQRAGLVVSRPILRPPQRRGQAQRRLRHHHEKQRQHEQRDDQDDRHQHAIVDPVRVFAQRRILLLQGDAVFHGHPLARGRLHADIGAGGRGRAPGACS